MGCLTLHSRTKTGMSDPGDASHVTISRIEGNRTAQLCVCAAIGVEEVLKGVFTQEKRLEEGD